MADEEKKTLTDQETGDEVKATPEYTEGEMDRLPEAETPIDEAVNMGLEASEKAADTPVVEAFDSTLSAVEEAVETLEPEIDEAVTDLRRPMLEGAAAAEEAGATQVDAEQYEFHEGFLSDTTVVFGRTITVEGGIYTVVFGFLAAATVLELLVGSLPHSALVVPILLALAVIKAALVVMYYMHLKVDTRLFAYILIVPTALALAAMLYLLSVPMTGY